MIVIDVMKDFKRSLTELNHLKHKDLKNSKQHFDAIKRN